MQLTPLYQLLIKIEDSKRVSLSDLEYVNPAILRGILGKMEAMKLVVKDETGYYSISKKGQDLLNSILDNLHKSTLHWDQKWRFVSFSIPESKRSLRDKYRREIEAMGLKMILTGLWITPLDLKDQLEQKAKDLGIFSNFMLIESSDISTGISQEQLRNLWPFDKSRQEIYDFINDSTNYLAQKQKISFETKKLIFKYAMILENQPKLPIELFPSDWPQFRAQLVYRKVRRLLSQKA